MKTEVKDNQLTIVVDLQPPYPSKSGKANLRYSSHGFTKLSNGMSISLNVIEPKK